MHRLIHMLLLVSLLFASIDGAIDIAKAGHPHEDAASQQMALADTAADDLEDGDNGRTSAPDHCEHCCHGHASVVMPNAQPPHFGRGATSHGRIANASFLNFSQAPPTPPPNA